MNLSKIKNSKIVRPILKVAPQWSKNTTFIIFGVIMGIVGVTIFNPGHIVQKSLNLVGIETGTEQKPLSEKTPLSKQTAQTDQADQVKTNEPGDTKTSNADGSDKKDSTTPKSKSEQSPAEPTGSHTVITPEDIQAQKESGASYLIQGTDWKVKINSQQPTSCGSQANPCPAGTTAAVNVSAYNVHTGELLPITECNGTWNKPYVGGDATPTSLLDSKHCVLSFTPSSSGMYRLQIELYLSKSVYTDTIYWGGWVWGTDSPTSGGYFVN